MGMSSSDDDAKIMKEYDMMRKIKALHPEYEVETHNMSEDMKIIYDDCLVRQHTGRMENRSVDFPSSYWHNLNQDVKYEARRTSPRRNESSYDDDDEVQDEYDDKIRELEKKIKIARLEQELEQLTSRKNKQ